MIEYANDLTLQVIPKNFEDNMKWREQVLGRIDREPDFAQEVIELCKRDIDFFFNGFLWTFDPRGGENKDLPFITYGFQDDFLLWLNGIYFEQKDGLVEKSRDMGVSWMILGFILQQWLFSAGFNALLGSYIEDLCDNHTLDSNFERLRYLIRNLPPCFYPLKNDKSVDYHMRLENKLNGNMIVGYAPTVNFSRQGRYSLVWTDEFAFWQQGRTAWTAMGDATKCRIVVSTPNGKGNKFADLALKSNIEKKTLHWSLHPKKTQEWYQAECERRTEEEIAQELDINYNKSVTGRVYHEFCERNYSDFQEYDPLQPLYVAWDFGDDSTSLIWLQLDKRDLTVRIVDAYENSKLFIDFFVPFVTGEVKSITGIRGYQYSTEELVMIEKHKRWQAATHYGDPTGGNHSNKYETTYFVELKKHGIIVNCNWAEFDFKTRHRKTTLLIRRLVVDKRLTSFIDAIENARYPDRGENSQATTANDKPIHDWTSHFRTALEYYATNEKVKGETNNTVISRSQDLIENKIKQLDRRRKVSNPSYKSAC